MKSISAFPAFAACAAPAQPRLKEVLAKVAVESLGSSPAEFAWLIREEGAVRARVIKVAGIKAD
jgi:hypothetical protein